MPTRDAFEAALWDGGDVVEAVGWPSELVVRSTQRFHDTLVAENPDRVAISDQYRCLSGSHDGRDAEFASDCRRLGQRAAVSVTSARASGNAADQAAEAVGKIRTSPATTFRASAGLLTMRAVPALAPGAAGMPWKRGATSKPPADAGASSGTCRFGTTPASLASP